MYSGLIGAGCIKLPTQLADSRVALKTALCSQHPLALVESAHGLVRRTSVCQAGHNSPPSQHTVRAVAVCPQGSSRQAGYHLPPRPDVLVEHAAGLAAPLVSHSNGRAAPDVPHITEGSLAVELHEAATSTHHRYERSHRPQPAHFAAYRPVPAWLPPEGPSTSSQDRPGAERNGSSGSYAPRKRLRGTVQSAHELEVARLKHTTRSLCAAATWQAVEAELARWRPQQLNHICVGAALVRLRRLGEGMGPEERAGLQASGLLPWLAGLMAAKLEDFNAQALANSLHAFAALGHPPGGQLLRDVEARALQLLPHCTPQGLGNTMWAFARLKHRPGPELLLAVEVAIVRRRGELGPLDLANLAWAYGSLGLPPHERCLEALVRGAVDKMPGSVQVQPLVNFLWALAKLQYRPAPAAASALQAELLRCLPRCNAQQLANAVWALGRLQLGTSQQLLAGIERCAAEQVHSFSPQGLANLLWAFAKLGHLPAPPRRRLFEEAVTAMVGEFPPLELAQMVWALGRLTEQQAGSGAELGAGSPGKGTGLRGEISLNGAGDDAAEPSPSSSSGRAELHDTAPSHILRHMQRPGSESLDGSHAAARKSNGASAAEQQPVLAGLAESFEPVGFRDSASGLREAWEGRGDERLVAALGQAVADKAGSFDADHCSMVLLGFALMGATPGSSALEAVCGQVHSRLDQITGQQLSTSLWALGRLGAAAPASVLLPGVGPAAARLACGMSARGQAALLVGLARLGYQPAEENMREVLTAVLERLSEQDSYGCSNVIWALATLSCELSGLELEALAEAVVAVLPQSKPQELAVMAWGLARLRHSPGPADPPTQHLAWLDLLCSRAAASLQPSPSALAPREAVMLLWACARLGHMPAGGSFDRLTAHVAAGADGLSGQGISNCLWAWGELRHHPGKGPLGALAGAAAAAAGGMSAQDVALALRGFARLSHRPSAAAMAALQAQAWEMLPRFSQHELRTVLLSMAALRHRPPPRFLLAAARAVNAAFDGKRSGVEQMPRPSVVPKQAAGSEAEGGAPAERGGTRGERGDMESSRECLDEEDGLTPGPVRTDGKIAAAAVGEEETVGRGEASGASSGVPTKSCGRGALLVTGKAQADADEPAFPQVASGSKAKRRKDKEKVWAALVAVGLDASLEEAARAQRARR